MTDKKETKKKSKWGGPRPGSGRPTGSGDYPEQVYARITREQRAFIDAHFSTDSDAVRAALDCLEKHPPKK